MKKEIKKEEVIKLNDDFVIEGDDEESFVQMIKKVVDATKYIRVESRNIDLLSYCDIPQLQEENKFSYYSINAEQIKKILSGYKMPVGRIKKADIAEELWPEIESGKGMAAVVNMEKFIINEDAVHNIARFAGVQGQTTASRANVLRNMHIADGIYSKYCVCGLVYREVNGTRKVFSVTGSRHEPIQQDIFLKINNYLIKKESAELLSWHFDHDMTRVVYKMETVGDFSLGLEIATSDTGKYSFTVRTLAIRNGGDIILDEAMFPHDELSTDLAYSGFTKYVKKEMRTKFTEFTEEIEQYKAKLLKKPLVNKSKSTTPAKKRKQVYDTVHRLNKKFYADVPLKVRITMSDIIVSSINSKMNVEENICNSYYDLFLETAEMATECLKTMLPHYRFAVKRKIPKLPEYLS